MASYALVVALGHSHSHEPAVCTASGDSSHGGGSSPSHACPTEEETAPKKSQPGRPSDSIPHDDCAVCRHFSQAAAPVQIAVELIGSEWVGEVAHALVVDQPILHTRTHDARGPPSICA